MKAAQTIPMADTWGMHGSGGWWILGVVVMMLFMGAMMWMMMRGMGGPSSHPPSTPSKAPGAEESPLEILERRFAQGEISIEEYRARREILLTGSAEASRDHDEQPLTT
jgi:putative membrane protein